MYHKWLFIFAGHRTIAPKKAKIIDAVKIKKVSAHLKGIAISIANCMHHILLDISSGEKYNDELARYWDQWCYGYI